jgi:hypothetical protein
VVGRSVRKGGLLVAALALALAASGCFYHQNLPYDAGPDGTRTTATFRIGPFDLAAMNEPGWEVLGTPSNLPKPAGNVAIRGFRYNVVDGTGKSVGLDKVHLHHIVLRDHSRTDPTCGGGARFSGTGAERTPLNLFGNYAYLSESTDRWSANFHIHTTSMTAVSDVYIEYKVEYQPATDPSAFRDVTPYFLDVTGCGNASIYDVPGGGGDNSVHEATRTYTAIADGIAVYAGGHIHAGGHQVSLVRDATGEDYCTATAHHQPGGHPTHPNLGQLHKISYCPMYSEVKDGEQFTLTSTYDNEFPIAKAMGIMLVYIWHPGGHPV